MDNTERIFEFIEEYIRKHIYGPTVREIQAGLDISSTSVVNYHLQKLEQKGYIERTPYKARSITIKEG